MKEPRLAGAWRLALDAAAAAAIAMACVYVGLAAQDGFGDWGLHGLGRRFLRSLFWSVPLAAVGGAVLSVIYGRALKPGVSALPILYGVPRMFALFPVIGAMCFVDFVAAGLAHARAVAAARRGGVAAPDFDESLAPRLTASIWYAFLPFVVMGMEVEGPFETPRAVAPRKLLRRLPVVLAAIAILTGAISDDTDERVNPVWLACFAAFWLADYLIVAARVAPVLLERERRRVTGAS